MYLERLQVEEGFLNGLDAGFTRGLNVIIGARGTGKTSVIEMIRYCLDAAGNTQETSKRSKEHALSILGSGQVTSTLSDDIRKVIVSRTSTDVLPRSMGAYQKPIIFSQTEVETIGLESTGRLKLIDSFIGEVLSDDTEEKQVIAIITSLTAEASSIRRELDEFELQSKELPVVEQELGAIAEREQSLAATSSILQQKTEQLQNISSRITANSIQEMSLLRTQNEVYNWYNNIKSALDFNIYSNNEVKSYLAHFSNQIVDIQTSLRKAHDLAANIWTDFENSKKQVVNQKLADEALAREARQEVEALQVGAGHVMRRGQELREKQARIISLMRQHDDKKIVLESLIQKRNEAFEKLEQIRANRFAARFKVIGELNASLGQNIRILIKRNGQQSKFASLISDLLRGSGIKYGEITPLIAAAVSPRMLLECVERFDTALISESSGITLERASRVLSHLRLCDLTSLGTLDLDDEVSMQLLDGIDYKDISSLSTGQRCTVILPIILAHKDRIIIVDQPEDHIDNAFITSTLIRAIISRSPTSQIIFSTHNPNIPVLGGADNVLHLGSDGKNGYVLARGNLNSQKVVDAISTVMEGGAEAFARRSYFYSQFN